jgi:hypothetical protein
MCFRDMTFCSAACLTTDCHRNFTEDQKAAAERWWGDPGAPVAFSDFSEKCADYRPAPDRTAPEVASEVCAHMAGSGRPNS